MGERCGAPSPGGHLKCLRSPHAQGGHVWEHSSSRHDPKDE